MGNKKKYIPDYLSDYPSDPLLVCSHGLCLLLPFIDAISRFPGQSHVNGNDNIWIYFTATYNEKGGVTISDLSIDNYYEEWAVLRRLHVRDNQKTVSSRFEPFMMPDGFGSGFTIPNSGGTFSGNSPITVFVEVGYQVYDGNEYFQIYPDEYISLPPLSSVLSYYQVK